LFTQPAAAVALNVGEATGVASFIGARSLVLGAAAVVVDGSDIGLTAGWV
jgi:hypothetical protein